MAVHGFDILQRRCQAGADRPDRLIGDHDCFRRRIFRQRTGKLAIDNLHRLPRFALCPRFTDTDDGDKSAFDSRKRLAEHRRIGLAMVGAPF